MDQKHKVIFSSKPTYEETSIYIKKTFLSSPPHQIGKSWHDTWHLQVVVSVKFHDRAWAILYPNSAIIILGLSSFGIWDMYEDYMATFFCVFSKTPKMKQLRSHRRLTATVLPTINNDLSVSLSAINFDKEQLESVLSVLPIGVLQPENEFRHHYGSRLDSCIVINTKINTNFPLMTRYIIQWILSFSCVNPLL